MSLVGNLEDLGLGEILQILCLSRKSGILSIYSSGKEGKITFRQGQVVRATSTALHQCVGELLVRRGGLSPARLREALWLQEEQGHRELLGQILIRNFEVPQEEIEGVVREQIEKVVYSFFAWTDGTFDFELVENVDVIDDIRMDPLQFVLQQGLNPQYLAMEGSRLMDELLHVEEPGATGEPAEENIDLAFNLLLGGSDEEPLAVTQSNAKQLLVVVDDDPATRQTIAEYMERHGYDVRGFERSDDALLALDALHGEVRRPLLVVDLIMPRRDGTGILGGLELLELVKGSFPGLTVLVMADYHNSEAERRVREMGFAFLMKPRRSELLDHDRCHLFGEELAAALAGMVRGEWQSQWSDQIDIGDELRMEIGDTDGRSAPRQVTDGIALLRSMLEELGNPAPAGGVLLLVLRFASEFLNRGIMFLVRQDELVGYGQFGMETGVGITDGWVRSLKVPISGHSLLTAATARRTPSKSPPGDAEWDRYLFERIGGRPKEFFLGPIVSEGRTIAVLYGDNLPEQRGIGETDTLEIFLSQAGMALERALLHRRLHEQRPEGL